MARAWEKEEVETKWEESAWAKKTAQKEKRKALNDFERFKVLRLKKQVSISTLAASKDLPSDLRALHC